MGKRTRFVILITALASLAAVLSPAAAGAVTWHNSGSTMFTATAGATSLSFTTAATVTCSSATATGTAPALVVGLTYSMSGTATFSGCMLSNVSTGIDCGYTLTGTSQAAGVLSGSVDLTCGVYQFGTKLCHLAGSVAGTYANGTPGVLALATGGSLTASNGPVGVCPLGTGDRWHLAGLTFRTTSASPPVITRTP